MASPRAILEAFFSAENRRDWERYAEFLHPDVEWTIGGRVVRGRDAYLATIVAAYAGSGARFGLHPIISSADGRLVATLLVDGEGGGPSTSSSSRAG